MKSNPLQVDLVEKHVATRVDIKIKFKNNEEPALLNQTTGKGDEK